MFDNVTLQRDVAPTVYLHCFLFRLHSAMTISVNANM